MDALVARDVDCDDEEFVGVFGIGLPAFRGVGRGVPVRFALLFPPRRELLPLALGVFSIP